MPGDAASPVASSSPIVSPVHQPAASYRRTRGTWYRGGSPGSSSGNAHHERVGRPVEVTTGGVVDAPRAPHRVVVR